MQKLGADIFPPAVASASGGGAEAVLSIVGWIRPQEIAEGSIVRDILHSVYCSNMVETIDFRGQPSMQAENLILDDSGNREVLEKVSEHFPNQVCSVFSEALIIKAIELVDLSVFVISSEDGDSIRPLDLEEEDVEKGFDAIESPIDVIAQEQIVGPLIRSGCTEGMPQIWKISRRSKNWP